MTADELKEKIETHYGTKFSRQDFIKDLLEKFDYGTILRASKKYKSISYFCTNAFSECGRLTEQMENYGKSDVDRQKYYYAKRTIEIFYDYISRQTEMNYRPKVIDENLIKEVEILNGKMYLHTWRGNPITFEYVGSLMVDAHITKYGYKAHPNIFGVLSEEVLLKQLEKTNADNKFFFERVLLRVQKDLKMGSKASAGQYVSCMNCRSNNNWKCGKNIVIQKVKCEFIDWK
jgi:hypothetical protein